MIEKKRTSSLRCSPPADIHVNIPGDLPYAVRTRELAESPPDHRMTDEFREEIGAEHGASSERDSRAREDCSTHEDRMGIEWVKFHQNLERRRWKKYLPKLCKKIKNGCDVVSPDWA